MKYFFYFFISLYSISSYGQIDTVKVSLVIDNNKKIIDKEVQISISSNKTKYTNSLNDSLIIIDRNNLDAEEVSLDFQSKLYKFHVDTIINIFESHNFEVVIISKNFKKKYQKKDIEFIYFIRFFVRLDSATLQKGLNSGTLYSVLRTRDFIVYKNKK